MPISISSQVLGTLSVTVAETTGTLEVAVLATAPAVLSVELGTPGPAATVEVGTTTTLSAGSSATVTNAGTSLAAVLNFGIPQGTQGIQGIQGNAGSAATVTAGTTTTLSPGASATVTNSGSFSTAIFNFGIPAGATGATGATGAAGAGVAVGGTTGQLLTKVSGTNYDTNWTTVIPGDRYLTSSVTSNTVSNGNKTFTIGTGLSYTPTQDLTISYNAANHMHGEVLTYNSGTGVLTVDIKNHTGTGTYTAWVVNVGGVTPATSVAWGAITGTLSAQTDLQTALDAKLSLSGGALTGPITMAGATIDSEISSDYFGIELSSDHAQYAELEYNQLTVSNSGGWTKVTPAGITFQDLSIQTTAGIPDAPSDGTPYVRFNGAWEQLNIT